MDTNQTKAAYVKPSLQRLGGISSLTAGGSGMMMEAMPMGMNLMRQRS